jgi:Cu+-exporting ATPase
MSETLQFTIEGEQKLNCQACERRVVKALQRIPGVESVQASHEKQQVLVGIEVAQVQSAQVLARLEQMGYEASMSTIPSRIDTGETEIKSPERFNSPAQANTAKFQMKLGGMHCSLCTDSIYKSLQRLEGIQDIQVSIAHQEALVTYNPAVLSTSSIEEVLEAIGFSVYQADDAEVFAHEEAELKMALAKAKQALLLLLAASGLMILALLWGPNPLRSYIMAALAVYISLGPARFILLRNGWQSIRRGILNQDVLVSSSALAGLIGGFVGLFNPSIPAGGFFGATVFVLGFHLIGGYVSVLVHVRASQSVRKLLSLEAPTARRLEADGSERELSLEQLRLGDLVRVRPGERIPVDGLVIEGASTVDESLVSGESIPQDKLPQDRVIGGSLNQTGSLLVRITALGKDSFLRTVARQVAEARAMKPGILRLVDRILLIYVPTVFAASAFGLLLWMLFPWFSTGEPDWLRASFAALSVLIMGYPCALGMATPLAIVRASGEAAERGILMRSGEAFQIFKNVQTIVFDKTGTLTLGKPSLTAIHALKGKSEELLRLSASAESLSEHPLAQAIVKAAQDRGITLAKAEDFDARPGRGIVARVENRQVHVGTLRFLEEEGIDCSALQPLLEDVQALGQTAVLVALQREALGLFALSDQLKPDAKATITRLQALGLEIVLLTGDNQQTAENIAQALGIQRVLAGVLPGEKAAEIRRLQQEGRQIAMVGDGINDAPALMQADLGIAIGTGTDIAIEAADVVLLGEGLENLLGARDLARRSYQLTVSNVVLALSFNAIGVLASISGLLQPVWAMLAMALSVTIVLLNSFILRLLPK